MPTAIKLLAAKMQLKVFIVAILGCGFFCEVGQVFVFVCYCCYLAFWVCWVFLPAAYFIIKLSDED